MPSRRVQLMVGLVRGRYSAVGCNCSWYGRKKINSAVEEKVAKVEEELKRVGGARNNLGSWSSCCSISVGVGATLVSALLSAGLCTSDWPWAELRLRVRLGGHVSQA
jgi:hypothetical protein